MNVHIQELINRCRRQILIQSFLYYRLNTSVGSDATYDQWAKDLAQLQMKYPEIASEGVYSDSFKDFSETITEFNSVIHGLFQEQCI
jgi:NAD-dependent DNA ligase